MPVGDLYLVTSTLRQLLSLNVRRLMGGVPPGQLTVTTMPPEQIEDPSQTLNLHLYHVAEDPNYKNAPSPGRGGIPVSRQPMALMLYYILTAHHEVSAEFDAETQQRLMGYALKTLHDFPIIDDHLEIEPRAAEGPVRVMDAGLVGSANRIETALRPITPEEALAFWTTEDQSTARLAAYYETRVVFLEPEPVRRYAGIVTDLGVFAGPALSPRLTGSRATLRFVPPAATGVGPQAVQIAPARATFNPAIVPPATEPDSAVEVVGSNLTAGLSRRLVLRTARWRDLDDPVVDADVDPALNPDWNVRFDTGSARFAMQPNLDIAEPGGGVRTIDVFPGIYGASLRTVMRQRMVGGETLRAETATAETAFALGPRIDDADPPDGDGRIAIRIVPVFDLAAADLRVEVTVDGEAYVRTDAFSDTDDDEGLFTVAADHVVVHPLFDPAVAGLHPVLLIVDGAESQPFWAST
jgi:hypothetical protein